MQKVRKSWIVSIIELVGEKGKYYKVTRRFLELQVQETKFFRTKKRAEQQFIEWLK